MFSFILSEGSATLVNLSTGNTTTLTTNDGNYATFVQYLKDRDFVAAERCGDVGSTVKSFVAGMADSGSFSVTVENGQATYFFQGKGPYQLHNAVIDRIVNMDAQGFDTQPLMNFMANLLNNPNPTAIEELYLFLEQNSLPITEDGCFIAYKIVKEDYMDIYSGTISNRIGEIPSMPRFEVDPNRNNTCSRGLHFCSKDYLSHYGSVNRSNDRCMLVKVNPADVVSIPSDYNNAKGRAWTYEIVSEMDDKEWRTLLSERDFTSAAVVSARAGEYFPPEDEFVEMDMADDYYLDDFHEEEEDTVRGLGTPVPVTGPGDSPADEIRAWEHISACGYDYNWGQSAWKDSTTGRFASILAVQEDTGYPVEFLKQLISY